MELIQNKLGLLLLQNNLEIKIILQNYSNVYFVNKCLQNIQINANIYILFILYIIKHTLLNLFTSIK